MTVHDAAAAGEMEWLESLLETFPERLQQRNKVGWTPLHLAAANGQLAAAAFLLDKGAHIDCRDQDDFATPLCWACYHGHLEMVDFLIERGADPATTADLHGFGPLGFATIHVYQPHVTERLLAKGVRHTVFTAVGAGDEEAVRRCVLANPRCLKERLTTYDELKTPLHLAASLGRTQIAEALINLGAHPGDPNSDEGPGSPFAFAIRCQDDNQLALMLLPEGDSQELFYHMIEGRPDQLSAYLKENTGLVGRHGTAPWALQAAAIRGWTQLIRPLVAAGAPVNHFWFGCTPLHRAALQGHREICEELLQLGAKPELHDEEIDADCAAWAYHAGHKELARFLKLEGSR